MKTQLVKYIPREEKSSRKLLNVFRNVIKNLD